LLSSSSITKELFDAYSEKDRRTKKIIQWYAILLGFFWFYPVTGNAVLALFPPEKVQKWFPDDKPGRACAANFNPTASDRRGAQPQAFSLDEFTAAASGTGSEPSSLSRHTLELSADTAQPR
jgi:hypothetical protein